MATVTAQVTQPGSPAAKLLYQGASNQQVSLVITVVTSSATVYVGGPNVKSTNGAPVVQADGPLTLTGFVGAVYFIGAAGSEVVSWAATPISGAAVANVTGIVADVAANTLAIETEATRAEDAEALLAPKDSPAFTTLMDVPKHATVGAPAYVEGRVYYDTTLHKLRVGGASAYETVTSV